MQTLNRKQVLKNRLIDFVKSTANEVDFFSVSTDINKGYWVYKGIIYHNDCYNIKAAKKAKVSQLDKNTVYYISTITNQRYLFNL